MVETYGSTAGTVSPELRRRLGKVYALLLRLLEESKTPSAQGDSRGAPGAQDDMPTRSGQTRV